MPLRNYRKRVGNALALDFVRNGAERVSPEKFLQILEERSSELKSFEFVPPRLGEKHFGYFEIEWKWPSYSMRTEHVG